ncbi:flagellin [Planktomarina temperata]|nr:flagellin [bacterium]MDB9764465.1 flagellin [Planktomarina temperata]
MTSINAGGAFYRVQNSLNQNSENVSKSMQRLASGQQNIAPGDRTASSAVAWGMKSEAASLKIGIQNGTEAMQAVEMLNNDIQAMNDIVVRLEELHALGTNGFNTTTDTAALTAEANTLMTEIARIADDAKWKGNAIADGTGKTVGFGRNGGSLSINVADLVVPFMPLGFNTATDPNFQQGTPGSGGAKINRTTLATVVTETAATPAPSPASPVISDVGGSAAAGDPIYGAHLDTAAADTVLSGANVAGGSAEAAYALLALKENVDTMAVTAGALFNQVSNVMSHLGSLNAGYALDVASKMDVDFAGETTELAKGQILAQAGTAMLAQANAQGQGMLALIQS